MKLTLREVQKERDMNDEQVELQGLRALDPQAITAAHNHYFPELYRYAVYRLNDRLTAEDIASEALVLLLEAVAAGKGPKSSLRGWLIGTAANLINDHYRLAYKRPTEPLPAEIASDSHSPVDHVEEVEREQVVNAALLELTPDQQHVLGLRFGGGYSLQETADIMKKNPNAVKALQFRGLASLRLKIGEGTI